jgi:hypothetical protein
MKVSWDDEIPNIWKNKTCSKPPTSCETILSMELDLHQKNMFLAGSIWFGRIYSEFSISKDQYVLARSQPVG